MPEYKIRLKSGRILGPIGIDPMRKLLEMGHADGSESVRIMPSRDWVAFTSVAELKALLPEPAPELEKTSLFSTQEKSSVIEEQHLGDKTALFDARTSLIDLEKAEPKGPAHPLADVIENPLLHREKTQSMQIPDEFRPKGPKEKKGKLPRKSFLVLLVLALLVYDEFFDDKDPSGAGRSILDAPVPMKPVRPHLPEAAAGPANPQKSTKLYEVGMRFYLQDTVQGYRKATDAFHRAISFDAENVKALAMLASSYLNLIDASNKDENTYSVINKLIELSRAKQIDLVETLIAEAEFYSLLNRNDAAIQRIVTYWKTFGKLDTALYFVLANLYVQKNDLASATKFLAQIPQDAVPMPKLFALRGLLAENAGDLTGAYNEYMRALKLNKMHAGALLGLVRVQEKKGDLKNATPFLEALLSNPSLMSPKQSVEAYLALSRVALLKKNAGAALKALANARMIEPKNEQVLLEYYTVASQADGGEDTKKYQALAKMYAYVLEADRALKAGKIHDATTVLIAAKDAFPKSSIPSERMGDLFFAEEDYIRAERNYKTAIEIDVSNPQVVVKYADTLLKLFEWEDAKKVVQRFVTRKEIASALDRVAGDLAGLQGAYGPALGLYKRAMSREQIDPEVYLAYAEVLSKTDDCKNAQFFFSLATRFDPQSERALLGTALCLLKTDGLPVAVAKVQEVLQRGQRVSPALLVLLAKIYWRGNDRTHALQFIDQARELDPSNAAAYALLSEIQTAQIPAEPKMLKLAIESASRYCELKPNDPSGFSKRHELWLRVPDFEQAALDLNRVFELSPRFPDLHLKRARVLIRLGRPADAVVELRDEVKLNPRNSKAWAELGEQLSAVGSHSESIQAFSQAGEIDPRNADAKSGAGYVNFLKRNYTAAISLLQTAIALDKGNPKHYRRLGDALKASGDREGARRAYQSYLDLYPDAPDRAEVQSGM